MKRVFAFIGFTAAITLIVLNIIDFRFVTLILSISAVLFAASLLIKKTRQARVLPIVLGSTVFACLIFMLVNVSAVIPARTLDGKTAYTEFQLVDIPEYDVDADKYTYTVKTKSIDCSGAPQSIKLKLKSSKKIDADYYDIICAGVRYYTICDNAFDSYGDYGAGVYIRGKIGLDYEVIPVESKPVNYYLILLRENIYQLINTHFKGDTAGLCIALLTGNKAFLSDNAINNFRICGISHYLAVSGFHISLICLGLYKFLNLIRTPKLLNTIVTLLVMFTYCGAADFSKSSVRACIMICVMLLSSLFNTKYDSLNSLGTAVFIICLNPFAVTDVSAVLTVSAMLGILVLFKAFKSKLSYGNRFSYKLDTVSLLSLCILLSIMPAMYIFFGDMSVGSVFLNFAAELLIICILVLVIFFCLFSYLTPFAFVISALLKAFCSWMLKLAGYVSSNYSFIYGSISGEIFGISLAAVFLFLGVILLAEKKIPVRQAAAVSLSVLVIGFSLSAYQNSRSAYVYINNSSMVIVCDKDSAVVVDMNGYYNEYEAQSFTRDKNVLCADTGENIDEDLSENISVSADNQSVIINVYDKVVEINSDYVIIDGYGFDRNAEDNQMITFSQNSQLALRRDNYG